MSKRSVSVMSLLILGLLLWIFLMSSLMVFLLTLLCFIFFFFNDTATTEIYTLSLHDALPISRPWSIAMAVAAFYWVNAALLRTMHHWFDVPFDLHSLLESMETQAALSILWTARSEEHTSELQSHLNLVCRLLLEKKKNRENSVSVSRRSVAMQTSRYVIDSRARTPYSRQQRYNRFIS